MTASGAPSPRFFLSATGMGLAFSNTAVAVPLLVLALRGDAALVGSLLATGTVSVAFGALVGGIASRRVGGARALAVALGLASAGSALLALARSVTELGVAAAVGGLGVGVFWVSSQLLLGRRSGKPGSEKGFLFHYASYTFGAVLGSSMTGAVTALGSHAGLAHDLAIRASAIVAGGTLVVALVLWWPHAARAATEALPRRRISIAPARHLSIQISDLMLVSALGCLLPLTPVVLARGYHLGPLVVGLVVAAVSIAKIAGTVVARVLSRANGQRATIFLLLGAAAVFSSLLTLAPSAPVFVGALLATALAGTGAWPLVVDSAQARVQPDRRHGLTVLWNTREYVVIAAATACSGWLLSIFGSPTPLFLLAALLIAGAAACSTAVWRRPVWTPDEPTSAVSTSG